MKSFISLLLTINVYFDAIVVSLFVLLRHLLLLSIFASVDACIVVVFFLIVSFVFLIFLSLPSLSFAVAALLWSFLLSLFVFVFIVSFSLDHLISLLSLLYLSLFTYLLHSFFDPISSSFFFSSSHVSYSSSSSAFLFIVRLWLCFTSSYSTPSLFFILHLIFSHFVLETQGQIVRSWGSLRRQLRQSVWYLLPRA